MPQYTYHARSVDGEERSGTISAVDEEHVVLQLRTEGYLVTNLHRSNEKQASRTEASLMDRLQRISLKDKLFFANNLAIMVASGLSISRALDNLAVQTKNPYLQKILRRIYDDVQKGSSLSESLAAHPKVFSELFVNMVRVGEIGGTLEESLQIVARQIEKEHALLSKVRGALIYPAVIICVMILVGIIMLTYILPQITDVFADMEITLPATTRFVIALSDVLRHHALLVAGGIIGLAAGASLFLRTPQGKRALSWLLLHTPAVKNMVIKINVARFARIYSSLLRSGVSVVETLGIVAHTLSNQYYQDALLAARKEIQKGTSVAEIIGRYEKIFPLMLIQMLIVGEETGKTEEMLDKLATFYEEEISQITKNLSSIIEPVLMVLVGGAVGFFAVAMLQPLYGVLENIQ